MATHSYVVLVLCKQGFQDLAAQHARCASEGDIFKVRHDVVLLDPIADVRSW